MSAVRIRTLTRDQISALIQCAQLVLAGEYPEEFTHSAAVVERAIERLQKNIPADDPPGEAELAIRKDERILCGRIADDYAAKVNPGEGRLAGSVIATRIYGRGTKP